MRPPSLRRRGPSGVQSRSGLGLGARCLIAGSSDPAAVLADLRTSCDGRGCGRSRPFAAAPRGGAAMLLGTVRPNPTKFGRDGRRASSARRIRSLMGKPSPGGGASGAKLPIAVPNAGTYASDPRHFGGLLSGGGRDRPGARRWGAPCARSLRPGSCCGAAPRPSARARAWHGPGHLPAPAVRHDAGGRPGHPRLVAPFR